MKTTITKIKKHNSEVGFSFFDKQRLNLTDAKTHEKVYIGNGQVLFLMSSKDAYHRVYHICEYHPMTGFVDKMLGTIPYAKLDDAKDFADKLTHEVKKRTPTKRKRATKKKPLKKSPTKTKNTKTKSLKPKTKSKNERKKL